MSAIADTYVPEGRTGWWGGPDLRRRCSACHKVAFICENAAKFSAVRTAMREAERGVPEAERMQAYLGKCGHWHVGHGRRKK